MPRSDASPWRSHARYALPYTLLAAAGAALALVASCGGGSKQPPIVYEARAADGTTNVWTIDVGSGAAKQITFGNAFDGNPGWSPDRKRIIFTSDRDGAAGKADVYTMRADGGDVRRLTDTPSPEWSPKYSPDGKSIAYVQVADDGSYVALMDADGSDPRRIAGPYKFAEFPEWTRDAREIYFSAIDQGRDDADIYSVDVATNEVKTRISTPAADVCPHFTYDGKTLTYASVLKGEQDSGNVDLFAHDMTSGDTRTDPDDTRLTTDEAIDDYGNPSPDGKTIVFISRRDGNAELYLMNRDGGNQQRITNTPDVNENLPDW